MENNLFSENVIEKRRREEGILLLKKTSMFIGVAMLINYSVGLFFAPIYFNLTALFGIDQNTAIAFVNNSFGNELINQILSVLMFTLPFFAVLSGCNLKSDEVISLKAPSGKMLLPTILLGMGFCGLANAAGNLMMSILEGFGISIPAVGGPEPQGTLGMIISLIGSVLIAPLCEELAMRGVVLGSLRCYGDRFAIIVSAVLFGLVHGRPQQIPFAFMVGLALGFAVVKTGSLWTGVIIHAINNLCASLISFASDKVSVELSSIMSIGFLAICLICGIVSVALFKGGKNEEELLPSGNKELSAAEACKIFFKSPIIIIYIVLTVITAVTRL